MGSNDIETILRSKLGELPMETVPNDWTAIQRGLGLAPKRSVPFGRVLSVAAAVLAALVVGGLLLNDPHDMPADLTTSLTTTSPERPPVELPSTPNEPLESSAADVIARLKQTFNETNARRAAALASTGDADIFPVFTGGDQPTAGESSASTPPPQTSRRSNRQGGTTVTSLFDRPFENPHMRRRSGSNWMLALFADGATRVGSDRRSTPRNFNTFAAADPVRQFASMNSIHSDAGLIASNELTSNGPIQERMLFDSPSLLQVTEASWNHQAPLTFGLSARKNLSERWGVELGLTYTYLLSKSSLSTATSRYDIRQQLHYLGVPLSVAYTPLRRGNFELYGRIGGAVDFNIGGKRTEHSLLNGASAFANVPTITRFTTNLPQWSVAARLGMMYKVSPTLGIYLEPGVGHYFRNSDQPESYWTDHPTHFNFQVGVRTAF
jgi:hypothetical protein